MTWIVVAYHQGRLSRNAYVKVEHNETGEERQLALADLMELINTLGGLPELSPAKARAWFGASWMSARRGYPEVQK